MFHVSVTFILDDRYLEKRTGRVMAMQLKSYPCFLCLQGERATGFGVALLMALFGQASDDPMLNQVSPLGQAANMSGDQMERDCKRRRLV